MKLLNVSGGFLRLIARRKNFKLEEKLDGGIAKKTAQLLLSRGGWEGLL